MLIKKAIESQFPNELLLPVAPPFCPIGLEKKESTGKEPGQLIGDQWYPVKWGNEISDGVKSQADAAGCNVGLILGKPVPSLRNDRLVIVDVDLDGEEKPEVARFCDAIERAFRIRVASILTPQQKARYTVWTRKTVSYRAAFLARIPSEQPPGKRHVIKITDEADNALGKSKIEFLTEGQYCVIGGKHHSGEQIKWYRSDMPNEFRDLPFLTEESVPSFGSWDDLVEVTKGALEQAIADEHNPFKHAKIAGKNVKPSNARPDQNANPRELAAPSAAALISLLNAMPNPSYVEREDYTAIMLAAAGCRYGLQYLRMLTPDDENLIAEAAAGWASRWEGPSPASFEDELEKWHTDWRRRDAYYSGWRHLKYHAGEFGADVESIALDEAQESFEAEERMPVPATVWNDNARHVAPDKTSLSEFWFATKFSDQAENRIHYIPEEKRWIAWGKSDEGWFDQHAQQWIRTKIREFLNNLVINRDGLSADELRHYLTASKVHNLERLLSDQTAFPRDKLNQAKWYIQTPECAYDLRTGLAISKIQQRKNMDTRYTNVTAKEGKTPKWDTMLYHLCEDNEETVEWLKHYLAYSIIGDPRAHKFLYIWGTGLNGKSTLLHIMMGILGSYAGSVDRDVWLMRGADKHPASLYKLRGVRLAVTSEMPPNEEWNESRLKAVTGQDAIEARVMHGAPQTFQPNAALIMVGQNIPMFSKIDNSITRRIAIIGTARSPAKIVPTLADDIVEEEGSAILWDLIQRCKQINKSQEYLPEMPAAMKAEVKDYLDKTDSFFAWASSELIIGPDSAEAVMPVGQLIDRYLAYHKRLHKDDPMAQMVNVEQNRFLSNLRRLGAITKDKSGKPLRIGEEMAVQGCKFRIEAVA